jgi:hypothetical protein
MSDADIRPSTSLLGLSSGAPAAPTRARSTTLAVEQAAASLLLPDGRSQPAWLLAAAALMERQTAPSRAELYAKVARVHNAVGALQRRLGGMAMLGPRVLDELPLAGVDRLLRQLSRAGQADAVDRLGFPAPKLVIACGVIALCEELCVALPGPRNKRAAALCSALLWRTHEQLNNDPDCPGWTIAVPAPNESWEGALRTARQTRETADRAEGVGAVPLTWYVIGQSIAQARRTR